MLFEGHIQSGVVKIEGEDTQYVNKLENRYPFVGSKIDWKEVPDSLDFNLMSLKASKVAYEITLKEGFNKIYNTIREMGYKDEYEIVIIGDNIFDVALRMSLGKLPQMYQELFELPQHTYIIPPDASWCINYTFEDYLYFGVAPK